MPDSLPNSHTQGRCSWCDEVVEPDNQNPAYANNPMHYACGFRAVAGSVAHIEKRCGCFVRGATENDDPALTKRQAAAASLAAFWLRHPLSEAPTPPQSSAGPSGDGLDKASTTDDVVPQQGVQAPHSQRKAGDSIGGGESDAG